MGKLTGKPKTNTADSIARAVEDPKDRDRRADAFINQGGKSLAPVTPSIPTVARGRVSEQADPEAKIGITVKLLVKERDAINELRRRRPTRSQVSLHDWIIEAVQEKLKTDSL
jgi:hypothetical protein